MIEVNNLSFHYGSSQVLKDIHLKAKNKRFIGIVGPNGSGKSTLLKCIYRVLKPQIGTVMLKGQNTQDMKVSDSAKMLSVVTQHNNHSFDFIVEDMVMMGRSPYKKALERNNFNDYKIVEESLKIVGMAQYRKREFSTLSGGEKQRIILARALAQKPECIVLDEPTNHLDIMHQLHLLNIIKELDICVVAAIHDLNIAMTYCDEIYVLNHGQVVKSGVTEDVLTEDLLREVFNVDANIHVLDGKHHIIFNGPYNV